jgi:hypothetical protein
LSPLNTFVRTCKETERWYLWCGPFSKQQKSLECVPLEELVFPCAASFKQACASNASIDGSITRRSCRSLLALQLTTSEVLLVGSTNKRRHKVIYKTVVAASSRRPEI